MVSTLVKAAVSIALLGLTALLVPWSLHEETVRRMPVVMPEKGPEKLHGFPKAYYFYGRTAFLQGRSDAAERYFEQAVSENVLYVEAWLRLAETAISQGEHALALQISTMLAEITEKATRWKWDQALLARELGQEEIFTDNINLLVRDTTRANDALWLLETHLGQNTPAVVERLVPHNRETYFRWLMRWRRAEDAIMAWNSLAPEKRENETLRLSFIHFLISNDNLVLARELWMRSSGPAGITNRGFEEPLTRRGFDWRFSDRKDEWNIRQTSVRAHSGRKALEIRFYGTANSYFNHLYQLVPVSPGVAYRLSYWWKALQISSDQGIFVEIVGKDCRGLGEKGPMILGSRDWRQVSVDFNAPEDCLAVVIRFRRQKSRRFDNKINGVLWLDDFVLQPVEKS
jgi:tetratricopeptide (TPR) repeat protein